MIVKDFYTYSRFFILDEDFFDDEA